MRNKILTQAKAWLGRNEADGSHKQIIDIYNSHKPLARGYKVKYTDSWCATFISALAIQCKMTDIIPLECSCGQMIKLAQQMGIWVEDDSYVPKPADIILYDWDDNGKGDNVAWPDHIGIVTDVKNGKITVIEGNLNNKVGYREIAVNGRYIRGYICPNYKTETKPTIQQNKTYVDIKAERLVKGSTGKAVKTLQTLLVAYGYGKFICDGIFGNKTLASVKDFQKKNNIGVDGVVGTITWSKLLGTN